MIRLQRRSLFLTSISIICLSISSSVFPQTLTLQSGTVKGVLSDGLTSYKGIPFAKPPVGALRWRAPQPVSPWSGIRAADHFGPACPQYLPAAFGPNPEQSEDCLYINVWQPQGATPASRLPVMVWIFGGGFTMGDAASSGNDPSNFARHGVVAVNFNYRLGRLGWFTTSPLSRESHTEGKADFGFMDQIAALRWVQDNIASFGGDPGNVTVFGTSAGGISVDLLMISPAARGLFSKAITQSGFGRLTLQPLAAAEAQGDDFAKMVGARDLDALRSLPVDKVIAPVQIETDSNAESAFPVLDGQLLPEQVVPAFARGKQVPVPWIIGSNSDEASLVPQLLSDPDRKVFVQILAPFRPLVIHLFDFKHNANREEIAANLVTDSIMTEPARALASSERKLGKPVYRYFFDYTPEGREHSTLGAKHGEEVPFVFRTFRPLQNGYSPSARDKATSERISSYWLNFAKTGDPNGRGLTLWPVDENDQLLLIDAFGEHAQAGFHKRQLDLLAFIAWIQTDSSHNILWCSALAFLSLAVAITAYMRRTARSKNNDAAQLAQSRLPARDTF